MIQDVKEIKDIKEIPYAIPDKNTNDDDLPISIEIIPHNAILVGVVEYRNMHTYKCCIVFFASIPLLLLFISLLLRD